MIWIRKPNGMIIAIISSFRKLKKPQQTQTQTTPKSKPPPQLFGLKLLHRSSVLSCFIFALQRQVWVFFVNNSSIVVYTSTTVDSDPICKIQSTVVDKKLIKSWSSTTRYNLLNSSLYLPTLFTI